MRSSYRNAAGSLEVPLIQQPMATVQDDQYPAVEHRLPGDKVQMKAGQLYINGQQVQRQPAGDCVADDNGIRMVQKGDAPKQGITTVMASADTVVLDDDLNPLEPGTGIVGRNSLEHRKNLRRRAVLGSVIAS